LITVDIKRHILELGLLYTVSSKCCRNKRNHRSNCRLPSRRPSGQDLLVRTSSSSSAIKLAKPIFLQIYLPAGPVFLPDPSRGPIHGHHHRHLDRKRPSPSPSGRPVHRTRTSSSYQDLAIPIYAQPHAGSWISGSIVSRP